MLRISIIQDHIFWTDKQANLEKTEKELQALMGKTDLVVLPELFSTGFCTDFPELAEPMSGETVSKLKNWAINYQLAISGSFMATEAEKVFNRAFFVFPSGEIHTADKRHVFTMAGEDKYFSAGKERLVVNYKNFNICLLVCYDLRFPVWSRNVNNAYDLLIYVANWPDSRIAAWDKLLPARAIENQSYLCAVNRIGKDGNNMEHGGHSKILDAKGDEICTTENHKKAIKTIGISKKELESFRTKFRAWQDADRFKIL